MYQLKNRTQGEVWHQRKRDLVVGSHDPSHEPALPKRMTPYDKRRYYNAKLKCVFAELGYCDTAEEVFELAEHYKAIRYSIFKVKT